MPLESAFWWYLQAGPGDFEETLDRARDATEDVKRNLATLANDTAGIMAQVVTQDTGYLAEKMGVIDAESDPGNNKYVIGSKALNRSLREYAFFEHKRHEGSSFFDTGERYANDMVFETGVAAINSLF